MMGFLASCLICVTILAVILYSRFGGTEYRLSPADLSTYFGTRDIMQEEQRIFCSVVCVFPLTMVYILSLYHANIISSGIVASIFQDFGVNFDSLHFIELKNVIPRYLLPFIILLFAVLFMGHWFISMQNRIESGILNLLGIRQQTNEASRDLAEVILRHMSYGGAISHLEVATNHPVRLPPELVGAPDIQRLSYQLLQLSRWEIPRFGVSGALRNVAERHFSGQIPSSERHEWRSRAASSDSMRYIASIFWVYVIVAAVYSCVIPLWGETFWNYGIEWPRYEKIWAHLIEIGVRTLSTILPMIVALLYVELKWQSLQNAQWIALYTLTSIIFVYSAVVNSCQIALYLLKIKLVTGEYTVMRIPSAVEGLVPEFIYIFGYAMVPAVTLPLLVLMRRRGKMDYWKAAVGAAMVGVGFYFAQLAFELSAKWEHANYEWHQGLLGLVLGLAALMPMAHRRRRVKSTQDGE